MPSREKKRVAQKCFTPLRNSILASSCGEFTQCLIIFWVLALCNGPFLQLQYLQKYSHTWGAFTLLLTFGGHSFHPRLLPFTSVSLLIFSFIVDPRLVHQAATNSSGLNRLTNVNQKWHKMVCTRYFYWG